MRTCNGRDSTGLECKRIIKSSTYFSSGSLRLSDGIGLSVQVKVDGITDLCGICIGRAVEEAARAAADILGGLKNE